MTYMTDKSVCLFTFLEPMNRERHDTAIGFKCTIYVHTQNQSGGRKQNRIEVESKSGIEVEIYFNRDRDRGGDRACPPGHGVVDPTHMLAAGAGRTSYSCLEAFWSTSCIWISTRSGLHGMAALRRAARGAPANKSGGPQPGITVLPAGVVRRRQLLDFKRFRMECPRAPPALLHTQVCSPKTNFGSSLSNSTGFRVSGGQARNSQSAARRSRLSLDPASVVVDGYSRPHFAAP
ncbi:hypothetical protein EVAR_61058_1 [Eumeta japonica]|uniref:Uncharacterized protein n=1 Tax=Eumeta variegata TaxID=151549 RepID=A0A4C1Z992_EUMVA|nr:hypothetical protein EVAR_61058_1 [Eumeta japonica]